MRKLASIVTVSSIMKMYQKDRIVCVSFEELAYEAIVSNTVNVGDKLAFIQEGSILPEINAWEFLRKRCYSEKLKGFVIRPMIMGTKETETGEKGERVRSWGLAVPLDELPIADERVINNLKPGDDLTDLLEIHKYEPEEDASPRTSSKKAYPKWVKFCLSHYLTRWIGRIWQKRHQKYGGNFPTDLISKSDETTIQNMKGVLEKFAESKVNISAKLEGQSFTVVPVFGKRGFIVKKEEVVGAYVCSRNNAYKIEDNSIFWDMMRKYDIVRKMKEIWKTEHKAYILQGEQVGPNIQDNIYDFKQNHWYIFTVKDYSTLKQLPYEGQIKVADKFGMRVVPLLWTGTLKDVMPDVDAAVAFAEKASWEPIDGDRIHSWLNLENKGHLWKDYIQHEGVVVRTVDYDKDNNIGVSFKVKNMDYQNQGLGKIHSCAVEYKKKNSK